MNYWRPRSVKRPTTSRNYPCATAYNSGESGGNRHSFPHLVVFSADPPARNKTIARDGLLVVRRDEPLAPSRECIIILHSILEGLVTALHLRLSSIMSSTQIGHPPIISMHLTWMLPLNGSLLAVISVLPSRASHTPSSLNLLVTLQRWLASRLQLMLSSTSDNSF